MMKYLVVVFLLIVVFAGSCGFIKRSVAGLVVGGALTTVGVGLAMTHDTTGNDVLRGFAPATSMIGVFTVIAALVAEIDRLKGENK